MVEIPPFFVAYAAMLGGTIGGQFLGILLDSIAIGRRIVWVPFVCSVIVEAIIGERVASARLERRLLASERMRLSVSYSLGLAALSLPLAGWLAASHSSREELASGMGVSSHEVITAGGIILVGLVVYTAVRTALMALFAKRHP